MSTQLVVRIPEQQKLLLEVIASNEKVSVGELTRLAIKDYIVKTAKGRKDLFTRLASIGKKKKITSAPADLSKNYKKYLYKA